MPDEPSEEPKKPPPPRRQPPLPTVAGESGQLDVVSRLLKDRILLLGTDVNDEMANVLVAQLLYLANEDPDKDITLYINSPAYEHRLSSNNGMDYVGVLLGPLEYFNQFAWLGKAVRKQRCDGRCLCTARAT